ncbi:lysosomal acid glucosylceramidase-like [Xylocopa sonorina]|uniref:lysosomal acid glucosylceramidase-like n=1 Tax=Xylocopa sonorina TaxID=1818115 RepID=UPI00403AE6EB
MWKLLLLIALLCGKGDSNDCVPRHVGIDGIICVCNATYCDTTPDANPKIPPNGKYYWYVSSKAGQRLHLTKGDFGSCGTSSLFDTTLEIDTTKRYQTIFGFGGAFTDSAGINIRKLSNATQKNLLLSYFGKEGSRYTLGRVPIGGTDFSTRPYTLDDHANDTSLKYFSLAPEDYNDKIPYIRKAIELSPELKILSAVWSPPAWMKTNNRLRGSFDFLKSEYYQLYADYILKFIDEYKKNGIDIWAVSTGNEPIDGFVPIPTINDMAWTPQTAATWVANNLGPTLASSAHNKTLILALDDQRIELPWAIQLLFMNEKAKNYIAGIAVHIYSDFLAPAQLLDLTHNEFPDKFILMTEASLGSASLIKVILGSWKRGETYMNSILQYLNHWSIGWVDWNLALDEKGGPTWVGNNIDASIIVNAEKDEFYKQPMYYAIKHFSRFIGRGSVRVSISDSFIVQSAAFVTPSNEVVVVLHNRNVIPARVSLKDPEKGDICLKLPANSMNTVIYAQ